MRAWYPALVLAGASLVIAFDPWWFLEVTSRLISFTWWCLQWTRALIEWTFWALKGALQVIEWTEWGVSSGVLILGVSVVSSVITCSGSVYHMWANLLPNSIFES